MIRIAKYISFAVWLIALSSAAARAQTINAANCTQSAVQAAINSASPGQTVNVPAGTCSWSGGISFTGISLIGAGSSASGTVITAGTVTMTKGSTTEARLSGFQFTNTDVHLNVFGTASNSPFRVDNNYFNMQGSDFQVIYYANGGVIDHNTFAGPPVTHNGNQGNTSIVDVMGVHPCGGGSCNEWSLPTTFGSTDTNGTSNIYFEDNTFSELAVALDGDEGARIVIRHNTFEASGVVFHGTQPDDSTPLTGSGGGGAREVEIYNNTFELLDVNDDNMANGWIWYRGESGVVVDNAMDSANTSQFGGKNDISLGVACNQSGFTTYPVPYQTGQSAVSSSEPENPPSHPVLIYGNSAGPNSNGAADSAFVEPINNDTANGTYQCSDPQDYIKVNRDYYLSDQWNWTPYTYPHPLVSGTESSGPKPPQNLTVSVQ